MSYSDLIDHEKNRKIKNKLPELFKLLKDSDEISYGDGQWVTNVLLVLNNVKPLLDDETDKETLDNFKSKFESPYAAQIQAAQIQDIREMYG